MAKLTREQISNLGDIELNRAMIWCYPPQCKIDDYGTFIEPLYEVGILCYLSDYNLTMPLAVDNEIFLAPMNNPTFQGFWTARNNKAIGYSCHNQNPLRAICEVLVMIALERGK